MYHSITFGDGSLYPSGHAKEGQFKGVNTWDDWHLIPSERPTIASPGVATNFVSIPGRDGSVDMSSFLVNRPVYGDRTGSFEFYVDNDHEYWITIRSKMMAYLHGKRMKMVFEDDPGWYWEGRFAVETWKSGANFSQVTINYTVSPYKMKISSEGTSDIVWDVFNFDTDNDYYTQFNEIAVSGSEKVLEFIGYELPFPVYAEVYPLTGSSVTIGLNGDSRTYDSVSHVTIGKAINGANRITLNGNGTVSISFTGGML